MKKPLFTHKGMLFLVVVLVVFSFFIVWGNKPELSQRHSMDEQQQDQGRKPWILDIEQTTITNDDYRNTRWTGQYMQLVFMSLKPGEIINLEVHEDHDQFIRIEKGEARVLMGTTRENLDFDHVVSDDWAVLIPAGYWHEIRNTGKGDLKLYTIYGPAEHPEGTIDLRQEQMRDH